MNGKGFLDNPTGTVSWGYNEYADCHKEYGCPAIGIITKNNLDTRKSTFLKKNTLFALFFKLIRNVPNLNAMTALKVNI